jgi:WD40 repeat protein
MRLAFGGFGRKAAQVNVLYAEEPDYALSLTASTNDNEPVSALDLDDDDGQKCCWLAVAHRGTGEIRLWKVDRGDAEESTKEPFARLRWTELDSAHYVAFAPDGKRLAVAGQKQGGGSAAAIFDVSDKDRLRGSASLTPAVRQDIEPATAIAWHDDQLIVGTENGIHLLGSDSSIRGADRFNRQRIDSLSPAGPDIVVVASSPLTTGEAGHKVNVLNLRSGTAQSLSTDLAFIDRAIVVAASPDGQWIAAAGLARSPIVGPAGEGLVPMVKVGLWKRNAEGAYRLAAEAPDEHHAAAVVAPLARVAVGEALGKPVIGFAWGPWDDEPHKTIRRGFALGTCTMVGRSASDQMVNLATGEKVRIALPQLSPEEWKMSRDVRDTKTGTYYGNVLMKRTRPQGAKLNDYVVGPLNGAGKHQALCYAWVKQPNRWLLAVGYQFGILIWDYDELQRRTLKDTSPAILRSFHGHTQQVNCLAAAPDGSWLVSGSQDGTICAWSLKDLPAPAAGGGEMGVVLRWDDRSKVYRVANDPAPGSPGWEAGFSRGQSFADPHRTWPAWQERLAAAKSFSEAFSVHLLGKPVDLWTRDADVSRDDRASGVIGWDRVLKPIGTDLYQFACLPGETLEVDVAVPGALGRRRLISRCSPDPLWTLYPLRNGHWFLHTPEGFYAKSAADVDLAWLVNESGSADLATGDGTLDRLTGGSLPQPEASFQETFSLDRIAKRHDKATMALLSQFLTSATPVGTFFQEAGVTHPLSNRPTRPLFHYTVSPSAADGATVVAVELTPTLGEELSALELRLNGWRLPGQKRLGKTKVTAAFSPAMLRTTGANEIVAVATVSSSVQSFRFADYYRLPFKAPPRPDRAVVHFLGVANGSVHTVDSNGVRSVAEGLRLPDCATDVGKVLKSVEAAFAEASERKPYRQSLTEATATKANLRQALIDLQDRSQPDDLAIIMLSGHGLMDSAAGRFAFVSHDASVQLVAPEPKVVGGTGISGEDLAEWIAGLNCRAILVLDTCHSGAAGTAQQLEGQASLGVGPMVLAACGAGEKAVSHQGEGGVFTAAIVRALERIQKERHLTVRAWCNEVRSQCQALVKTQRPEIVPSRTFFEFEPICR